MVWVQIALFVVSLAVSYYLQPTPDSPKAASLADFSAPTADETRPIPVLFGTRWIKGPNVVWFGDLRTRAIKKKGGKK